MILNLLFIVSGWVNRVIFFLLYHNGVIYKYDVAKWGFLTIEKEINNDTVYNNEDLRKYWLLKKTIIIKI